MLETKLSLEKQKKQKTCSGTVFQRERPTMSVRKTSGQLAFGSSRRISLEMRIAGGHGNRGKMNIRMKFPSYFLPSHRWGLQLLRPLSSVSHSGHLLCQ